jgi:hypothetical protein
MKKAVEQQRSRNHVAEPFNAAAPDPEQCQGSSDRPHGNHPDLTTFTR